MIGVDFACFGDMPDSTAGAAAATGAASALNEPLACKF